MLSCKFFFSRKQLYVKESNIEILCDIKINWKWQERKKNVTLYFIVSIENSLNRDEIQTSIMKIWEKKVYFIIYEKNKRG